MDWQLVNVTISAAASLSSALMVGYAWRRRQVQGANWFSGLLAAVSWVTFCYIFEALAGTNVAAYVAFSKFEYIGLTTIPIFWLGFALTFSGRERRLSRSLLATLMIIPAVTILLAFTNDWHGYIWEMPRFVMLNGQPVFEPEYGGWFWVYVIYSYVVFFGGSVILLRRAFGLWGLYRAQAALVFAGTALPWISNLLLIFDTLNPVPYLYINAIFLSLCMLCFAFALFRLHLLDIMPMAYDVVLNNVPDGLLVVDMKDRIVAANDCIRKYVTDRSADPIGMSLRSAFAGYEAQVDAVEGKFEYQGEMPAGDLIVDVRISPLVDSSGRRRGRLLILSDVTAKAKSAEAERNEKRFAETMRQISHTLNSTLDMDQVLSLILDSMGELITHSHANILLIGPDGYTGRIRKHRGYETEQAMYLESFTVDYRTQPILMQAVTAPVIIPDTQVYGGWRTPDRFDTVRCYACAAIQIDGKLTGFINVDSTVPNAIMPDMANRLQIFAQQAALAIKNAQLVESLAAHANELERLYERVSRLEHLKSDMIRIAAHDLKNPLTVIMSYLSFLTDPVASATITNPHDTYISMQNSAERMFQIIQNFLSVERIQKVADNQTVEVFDLRDSVRKAAKEFKNCSREKLLKLEITVPETACPVYADPIQVYEAVSNFVSNAVKYTPEGGHIQVMLRCDGSNACVEVSDTGCGIPEDQQAQMFQPFFRAQTRETAKIEGSGLGLYLTKKIIERQGGCVTFQSTYGKGSTFGFQLPLSKAEPVPLLLEA